MRNCLGIYIENNLIKYAKISKNKEIFKIEAYGVEFFSSNLKMEISKIIDETNSFKTPISINLLNERYLYFDILATLSKKDVPKVIQTEYERYCDKHKYDYKTFETRYALVPNIQDKDKIKAIQVIANKIEIDKQKQYLEKNNLAKILPIGVAISSIVKLEKDDNVLIVNMEEKTTITTICDMKVHNIEVWDIGSQEVLEKISKAENSMAKAYEICKTTTIYTSNSIYSAKEQIYLENIIPTLYKIAKNLEQIIKGSPVKISTIYLTGNLSVVNNIDLYFQEILPAIECRVLKPSIIKDDTTQINIKDYIEVNSAIALAVQGLGLKKENNLLNFQNTSFTKKLKHKITEKKHRKTVKPSIKVNQTELIQKEIKEVTEPQVESIKPIQKKEIPQKPKLKKIKPPTLTPKILQIQENIHHETSNDTTTKVSKKASNKFFKAKLTTSECVLLKGIGIILLMWLVFIIFSKLLYSQMDNKQEEIERLISAENEEIAKINDDIDKIKLKITEYETLTEELKSTDDKTNTEEKISISNLLNEIKEIMPEEVQLESIQKITDRNIEIVVTSDNYDKLRYFTVKMKLGDILNNATSSSEENNDNLITVKIEGELP